MIEIASFVLGLKRNFRGENLINSLEELGFVPKIIWGLDVSVFSTEYLDSLIDQKKCNLLLGRNLSHYELSCALGHLEMYEEFLRTDAKWGLFLEDDAQINNEFLDLVSRIPFLDKPVVLSLASSEDPRFEPRPFPFCPESADSISLGEFKLCAIPPVLAHGYLMNRSAALIAAHTLRGKKIYAPADFPFDFRNSVQFYASEIEYVGVRDTKSNIEESRLETYEVIKPRSPKNNFRRRKRVVIDYSGLGVLYAKRIGMSGRFYYHEKVRLRKFYKKFLKNTSGVSAR